MTIKLVTTIKRFTCLTTDLPSLTAPEGSIADCDDGNEYMMVNGAWTMQVPPGGDVTLAASQPLYAPSKAGNKMDLIDAPNATAITAIQSGLAKDNTVAKDATVAKDSTVAKDATVMKAASYSAPDNTTIGAIQTEVQTDTLAAGDGSNADYARIGALVRYLIDNFGSQQLTTYYAELTSAPISATGTTWADLYDGSVLTCPTQLIGFTFTKDGVWAGTASIRIIDATGNVILPEWFENDIRSWVDGSPWTPPIGTLKIAQAAGFKIQFRSTDAGDVSGPALTLTLADALQEK